MAVLLRSAGGRVFLEVKVEHLRDAVLRLDVMAAVGLRAVDELDFFSLAPARHGAQPRPLPAQAVLALERAHENPGLLAVIVRFNFHGASPQSLAALESGA